MSIYDITTTQDYSIAPLNISIELSGSGIIFVNMLYELIDILEKIPNELITVSNESDN